MNETSSNSEILKYSPRPSLGKPALVCMAATGALALSMFLVFQDMVSSNRPHELHNAPWVAGITFLNLAPCVWTFLKLRLYRLASIGRNLGLRFFGLCAALVTVAGLDAFIFACAASTVPAVLLG
ncbi:MAG: hypothetical protein ACI8X5_003002 [Planctomycetota bacterium]|jgi:hypothetical protein